MTARSSREPAGERPIHARIDFAEIYEQALVGPLFRHWVEPLLDDVGLGPHDRLLGVACGTGIVARVAKERPGPSGRIVGVDLNPQMLAVARRVAPTIDWRQGDAGALPLGADERFDVIVCHQGFQFFPDRAAAARRSPTWTAKHAGASSRPSPMTAPISSGAIPMKPDWRSRSSPMSSRLGSEWLMPRSS